MDGNAQIIGDGTQDIVIKTRSKVWIQVGEKKNRIKI